jgi:signal transduction histidine kinase
MDPQQSPKRAASGSTSARPTAEPCFATGTAELPPLTIAHVLREDDVVQIVHDLRDPIATIALETYLLDRKLANGDHLDVRSITARILRNVEYLDRIVQNLLDTCAAGEGHLELHRRPTELRALLEHVIDRAVSSRDYGRVVLEAAAPVTVMADDLRIGRVVANLIGNALKYPPPDSKIVVRLEAGSLAAQISVTDAGPGLSPEEAEHIFDKFRRGSNAQGRDGCGLGLYVSRVIVEAHGGRIAVDRSPIGGSRFHFYLPF